MVAHSIFDPQSNLELTCRNCSHLMKRHVQRPIEGEGHLERINEIRCSFCGSDRISEVKPEPVHTTYRASSDAEKLDRILRDPK